MKIQTMNIDTLEWKTKLESDHIRLDVGDAIYTLHYDGRFIGIVKRNVSGEKSELCVYPDDFNSINVE